MNPCLQTIVESVREAVLSHAGQTAGYCGVASSILCMELERMGYSPRLIRGRYSWYAHYWVCVGEEILDPTRCQFDEGARYGHKSLMGNYFPETEVSAAELFARFEKKHPRLKRMFAQAKLNQSPLAV